MTQSKRSNSGFTLLELIVVVGIIGIAMAIAIPGFLNWVPNYRLRQATGDLLTNLQRARVEAVKRNLPCTLAFDVTVNGTTFDYAAFVDNNNDGAFDAGETPLVTTMWTDYPGITRGAVTNGGVIRFNTRGQPLAGGIQVDLQNNQGNSTRVIVNLLGNARIVRL